MRRTCPGEDDRSMRTTSPVRAEHSHPTRPAPPAHLEWLRSELADWQREGLVDELQAGAILSRYHAARRVNLARLLLVLGAVFVGFGLIWLVAANLDELPPLLRFGAVAAAWAAVTVGSELLAVRRAHGGTIPSPVVHAGRLLAALLFGAVIFQAAQSLQVPAYEPRLVGLWALGALAHGYLVRAAAPIALGVVAALAWVIWNASWSEPSALGIVLAVSAAGVVAVSVAALHERLHGAAPQQGWRQLSAPWREAGAVALLGALFTAAMPFLGTSGFAWTTTSTVLVVVAVVLAGTALALTAPARTGRWVWAEPLGALVVTGLAVLLLQWEAGADADRVGLEDWAHAGVAVVTYLVVAAGVAVMGILRDSSHLTVTALGALVVFTTFQSFAVFAPIIQGAWLFLVMGLILGGTGYLADRARRQLAQSLDELPRSASSHGGAR
jgi:uncharacterized membrane protein